MAGTSQTVLNRAFSPLDIFEKFFSYKKQPQQQHHPSKVQEKCDFLIKSAEDPSKKRQKFSRNSKCFVFIFSQFLSETLQTEIKLKLFKCQDGMSLDQSGDQNSI
jgi:hypothetical protein